MTRASHPSHRQHAVVTHRHLVSEAAAAFNSRLCRFCFALRFCGVCGIGVWDKGSWSAVSCRRRLLCTKIKIVLDIIITADCFVEHATMHFIRSGADVVKSRDRVGCGKCGSGLPVAPGPPQSRERFWSPAFESIHSLIESPRSERGIEQNFRNDKLIKFCGSRHSRQRV